MVEYECGDLTRGVAEESSFSLFGVKISYFSINFVPPFEGVGFISLPHGNLRIEKETPRIL
jgi:hypothetical protein